MMPLRHAILRNLLLAPADRVFVNAPGGRDVLAALLTAHAFDASAVGDAAFLLGVELANGTGANWFEGASHLLFAPAKTCWIEVNSGARTGFLIIEHDDRSMDVSVVVENASVAEFSLPGPEKGIDPLSRFNLSLEFLNHSDKVEAARRGVNCAYFCFFGLLVMINSPEAFGRQGGEAHKGLLKSLKAVRRGVQPTIAETTILLGRPRSPHERVDSAEEDREREKAYHFVKSFERWAPYHTGRQRVAGHWRGDLSLGLRIGSYTFGEQAPRP